MKKIIVPFLILGILAIVYTAYSIQRNEIKENALTEIPQVSILAEKKPYNKIKSEWPEGDVLGNISEITKNAVTIEELISWKCFYGFDYATDENKKMSKEEIDLKYNLEYFPWCTDPSGGSLYEETGKKLTFNFDNTTSFFIANFHSEPQMSNVKKDIFIGKVKEYQLYTSTMMVSLTLDNNTVIKIQEVYND